MSEYQESHSVMRLFGAPPSYVGYDEGGQLTKFVSNNPNGVVVFDEAEKAHPDVLNALLQIAEEGTLTDGKGKVVSFAETMVFITTNIGAQEASQRAMGFNAGEVSRTHAFKTALEKFFRPELRGRLTDTIIFEPLTANEILRIADLELAKISQRLLDNRSIKLDFATAINTWIAKQSNTLQYGARNLKVVIANLIAAPLSDFIVAGKLSGKVLIRVGVDENEAVTFNAPPPSRVTSRLSAKNAHIIGLVWAFYL
jgi:ATP-dependent Clp protease ATP-binding subunit ClpC